MNGHSDGPIERAVRETAEGDRELLAAAARAVPKAWGWLAARGVVRFRQLAGRAPTEAERRDIWHGLWREVERERERAAATGS